jgi:hypothetical protein
VVAGAVVVVDVAVPMAAAMVVVVVDAIVVVVAGAVVVVEVDVVVEELSPRRPDRMASASISVDVVELLISRSSSRPLADPAIVQTTLATHIADTASVTAVDRAMTERTDVVDEGIGVTPRRRGTGGGR